MQTLLGQHLVEVMLSTWQCSLLAVAMQVLQIALASVYGLVGLAVYKSWLPSACLGAVLLAVPMVSII